MRAGRDDLLGLRLLEDLGVLHRQLGEHDLVAGAARGVAVAGLTIAQDAEGDASDVEQLGDGLRGLSRPVLIGAGATDPEQPVDALQIIDVFADLLDFEVQVLGPSPSACSGSCSRGCPCAPGP